MTKMMKILAGLMLVTLLATACSLIGQGTPAPASGTPNATLTALFDLSNPPATVPPPLVTATTGAPLPTVAQPTSAPAASSTPVNLPTTKPTNTPAALQERTGTAMNAGYVGTAPVLDGTWSEWRDKTTLYSVAYRVWGAKNWTGTADLEASFGAVWDDKNLYVGFKIFDDKYVQNTTGKDMYKGDSMELLVDANLNGDLSIQQLNADDYQLGISCGNPDKGVNPEAYLWFPSGSAGSKTSVKVVCKFESDYYRAEAAIPWSLLGITPSNGLTVGFAASVSDNDDASQNVQQTMLSTAPDRVLTDPTTWGKLTLVK